MTIYRKTNYRKIYENHYGPIPKDDQGRSYDIHHIDGDRSNNSPLNLKAVSMQEHYDIHYSQGDWAACHRLSFKLGLTAKEISDLASRNAKEQVKNGTHNFLGGEIQRRSGQKRVIEGTHPFLGGEISRATTQRRLASGSHHFIGNSNPVYTQLQNGNHPFAGPHAPSQIMWTCPHCGKIGKGRGNYTRFHGDSCKHRVT
jgi:hypothetical protein